MEKKNRKRKIGKRIKKIQDIIITIKEDPEAMRQAKKLIATC